MGYLPVSWIIRSIVGLSELVRNFAYVAFGIGRGQIKLQNSKSITPLSMKILI